MRRTDAVAAAATVRWAPASGPVLALACLALLGCRCATAPAPAAPSAPTTPASAGAVERPAQVTAVEPAPDARVAADVTVSARLDFARGPRPVAPASLRLLIDDEDVTAAARVAYTEDVPPSQGEISYAPPQRFAPGGHRAEVRFADDQGTPYSYAWSFTVAGD